MASSRELEGEMERSFVEVSLRNAEFLRIRRRLNRERRLLSRYRCAGMLRDGQKWHRQDHIKERDEPSLERFEQPSFELLSHPHLAPKPPDQICPFGRTCPDALEASDYHGKQRQLKCAVDLPIVRDDAL